MTIREAIAFGVRMLADVPDPKLDTVELLCNVTGEQALPLQLNASRTLTVEQEERFRSLLLLRANRTPLQYLLGTRCFYGLDFRVDERVLIPRQETETLCENALLRMRALTAPRVLDVCTGSGAIAVTLRAQCPQAVVTATDISADALALAEENAARHVFLVIHCIGNGRLHFGLGDRFPCNFDDGGLSIHRRIFLDEAAARG